MVELARLEVGDPLAGVVNALAEIVAIQSQRIDLIEQHLAFLVDVLELDDGPGVWREIVNLPDIATYQPEEDQ